MFALLQAGAMAAATPATRIQLPNGLRVWIREDHARPVALVQVTYKAGSINEDPGQTGIAHYVEHMVYRATRNIRNEDVYGYIDRIGGRYTGGTWPEYTQYAETVPSWALESALRVTAERMCCALFDSTEFERERSNVVTEANGFSDSDPLNAMRDAVMYASFEVHPYRLNSNTWARDNLVLRRDDAFAWYKRHYGPNNAVLVVVGDVATADVRGLVEKYFGALDRAPSDGRVRIVEPPQRAEKRITITGPATKPHMEVVYRAPNAAHTDYPAFTVLRRLLETRMRGGADPARDDLTLADSASEYPFVLRLRVTRSSREALDEVLGNLDAAIDRLRRDGASTGEIAAAIPTRVAQPPVAPPAAGGAIPPRRSNLTRVADSLAGLEMMPWEVSADVRARIERETRRVASADIRRVADRWLRRSQRTIGLLLPGSDDFVPAWSDDRPLIGERMVIPPLTTPPARRMRPEPVPARALEPLAPLSLARARRVLANGMVVRVARRSGAEIAIHVRVDSGAASPSGGHVDLRRTVTAAMATSALDSLAGEVSARYPAGALAVAIVGPDDTSALLSAASAVFSRLPRRRAIAASSPRSPVRDTAAPPATATQVTIVARLPGVSRDHPDRRALELLNYIVGVPSYGGRLGWALTKSGLTYAVAARTTFGATSGEITLSTTADTRNTPATIQAIREVVAGVGANGVEEWELREAQAFTLGRATLYGARDDSPPASIAAALLDSETSAVDLLDLPAFSRAYLAVTPVEINRVARVHYRSERLSVAATGALPNSTEQSIFPDGTFRRIFDP